MQIIEELEQNRRGLYCGAIGCIGTQPNSDGAPHPLGTLNIAIRTLQMHGTIATLHAGAGIVADSDPALEYEETLHKAAALLRALGV
jgi:anthranilate/para-aminobenzoate synthase component I